MNTTRNAMAAGIQNARWRKATVEIGAGIVVAALVGACVPISPEAPAAAPAAASEAASSVESNALAEQLPNLTYPIDVVPSGEVTLVDGTYSEPAAPGSATMTTVQLGAQQAYGDLNGDGVDDAATTLVADPGGSGTFIYLSAVLDEGGVGVPVSTVLLGDRVEITHLSIFEEQITVELLTVAEGEPMAAEPTVKVTQVYQLQDNQLVQVQ